MRSVRLQIRTLTAARGEARMARTLPVDAAAGQRAGLVAAAAVDVVVDDVDAPEATVFLSFGAVVAFVAILWAARSGEQQAQQGNRCTRCPLHHQSSPIHA